MFHKLDPYILTNSVILSVVGIFTLISTSIDLDGNIVWGEIVTKQALFILVGFILFLIISNLNYTYLSHPQVVATLYTVTVILLGLTLVIGPTINNVKRWLALPGFNFQTSELAKVVLIIATASVFGYMQMKLNEWHRLGISLAVTLGLAVLIYLQPHGSMSFIMAMIWFLIALTYMPSQLRNVLLLAQVAFLTSGVLSLLLGIVGLGVALIILGLIVTIYAYNLRDAWRKLFIIAAILALPAGVFLSYGWNNILQDYQQDRIEVFLNGEDSDPDKRFNVDQSKIAIGSGGLWGKGFGAGTQSRLRYLPERSTDFIFATFAEQFGLVASLLLITVYAALIIRILFMAFTYSDDTFASALLLGLAIKILLETFINIGTSVGVIPATGIPLPLVSAGGSSVLMTFISLGLVQSVLKHKSDDNNMETPVDNSDLLI